MSTAYRVIISNIYPSSTLAADPIFKTIWNQPCLPKNSFFFWTLAHNDIPCRETLAHRSIISDSSCPRCNSEETALHLLRDCPVIHDIWKQIIHRQTNTTYFSTSITKWIHLNFTSNVVVSALSLPWNCLFSVITWKIWTDRNNLVFNGRTQLQTVIHSAKALTAEIISCKQSFIPTYTQSFVTVQWKPPSQGWFKLNSDSWVDNNSAGAGGVIRDHTGTWIAGFSKNLGSMNIFHAELWGVREGLLIALSFNCSHIEINIDSASSCFLHYR